MVDLGEQPCRPRRGGNSGPDDPMSLFNGERGIKRRAPFSGCLGGIGADARHAFSEL